MPPLNSEQYRSAVYIDFEGEGRSEQRPLPKPHMCGSFRPNSTGQNGKYEAIFFKKLWKPAMNGAHGTAKIHSFSDYFESLCDEASDKSSFIVYWTEHEEKVLQKFLETALFSKIKPYLHNLHPTASRYMNRYQKFGTNQTARGKSLEDFFKAMYENRPLQHSMTEGPAEACRGIDKACRNKKKWKSFNEQQQNYVNDLIAYNKGDCRSTWLIAKRIGNHYDSAG